MKPSAQLGLEAFEQLLEIHGGRVERWPEATREPLRQLLGSSDVARARWQEAERLEALLDALPEVEPAPTLLARIASLPVLHPRTARAVWWPFGNTLAPLLGWGAAAVLGVVVGITEPSSLADLAGDDVVADADPGSDGVASSDDALDDATQDDWSEVSGLVMGADWALEDE